MSVLLPPPDSYDDHTLTEYVEALMLCEDVDHLSMAELVSRFPSGRRPSNVDTGLIRSAITKRRFELGDAYPYEADEAGIRRTPVAGLPVYDFLVLLSLEYGPYRQAVEYNEANKIFDFLVREALKAMLGPTGQAVRFGTPVQDGRPENIEDAIPWLADLMGVATGVPDLVVDDNDYGVDVVAWRPFTSGRSSFPVWLVQATVQMNYVDKAGRVPVPAWVRALDIGPAPQVGLAFPFTVQDGDDRWMKMGIITDMILDRVRICELLDVTLLENYPEAADLQAFIAGELARWENTVVDLRSATPRVAKPRRQRASEARDPLRR